MKDPLIALYLKKKREIDEGIYYIVKNNKNKDVYILLPYIHLGRGAYNWSEDKICFETKEEMIKFANKLNIPISSSEEI